MDLGGVAEGKLQSKYIIQKKSTKINEDKSSVNIIFWSMGREQDYSNFST